MHYSAQTNTIMHTGDWSNQGEGLTVQNQEAMKPDNYTEVETLVVVTKEETPYVMKKRGRKGNAAYDGFAIDLLKVKSRLNPFEWRRISFLSKRTKESLIMDSVASQQISQNFFVFPFNHLSIFISCLRGQIQKMKKGKEKIEKNFLGHLKKLVNILSAAPKKF